MRVVTPLSFSGHLIVALGIVNWIYAFSRSHSRNGQMFVHCDAIWATCGLGLACGDCLLIICDLMRKFFYQTTIL